MCQKKNSPIKSKYRHPVFGKGCADYCLVDVINFLNSDKQLVTIASCCGHGNSHRIPYLTLVQPESRIAEIKAHIGNYVGWENIAVKVFSDFPDDIYFQMGFNFMSGKSYVGYYAGAFWLDIEFSDNCEGCSYDLQVA